MLLAMPIVCVYSDQQPGFRADPAQHQAEGAHGSCRVRTHHRRRHQGHQGGSPQAILSLSTLLCPSFDPSCPSFDPSFPSFDPSCPSFV
jgi:hypothetical protein